MPPCPKTPSPTPHHRAHRNPAFVKTPSASGTDAGTSHTPTTTPCGPPHTPPSAFASRQPPHPHTPGPPDSSPSVTACSASAHAFKSVKVHTAKCSECDKRNMDTMRRCPGCTFQLCKPCYDKRIKAGRALTHGNMLTPVAATPGTASASVLRRRLASSVAIAEGQVEKNEETESGLSPVKLKLILKSPIGTKRASRQRAQPNGSDTGESSAEEAASDSPIVYKRRRIVPPSSSIATPTLPATRKPPLTGLADDRAEVTMAETAPENTYHQSLDSLLQQHGVHTPANPYKEHLLSRYTPVTTNPVIYIPPNVKRAFKPRPTATEIQQNLQDKVRQKLEAPQTKSTTTVRLFVEDVAMAYPQFASLGQDEQDEFVSALKEVARKWAIQFFNNMTMAGHTGLVRGLDMRLDTIGPESRAGLETTVAECAVRKLWELARESEPRQDMPQTHA